MAPGRSTFRASIICMSLLVPLGGCATLPAQETLDFEKIMAAHGKALVDLTRADQEARIATAQVQFVASDGRVVLTNCNVNDVEDCAVTYSMPGLPPLKLRPAAENVTALHASLERYATEMHTLAEAKDLEAVKAKAQATAASIKAFALAANIPGGIVGAFADGAVLAGSASLREKRRRAMLVNALAARPVVKVAADRIGPVSELMRRNVLEAKSLEMKAIEQRNDDDGAEILWRRARVPDGQMPDPGTATRLEALQQRRSAGVADLVKMAGEINHIRSDKIPFAKIIYLHDLLIYVLQNPRASYEETMAVVIALEAAIAGISSPATKEQ